MQFPLFCQGRHGRYRRSFCFCVSLCDLVTSEPTRNSGQRRLLVRRLQKDVTHSWSLATDHTGTWLPKGGQFQLTPSCRFRRRHQVLVSAKSDARIPVPYHAGYGYSGNWLVTGKLETASLPGAARHSGYSLRDGRRLFNYRRPAEFLILNLGRREGFIFFSHEEKRKHYWISSYTVNVLD